MPEIVRGMNQLDRKLTQFAKRSTRTRIKRKSITKANRPVVQKVKDNTPRTKTPLRGRKRLRSTITSKVQTIKGTDVVVGITGQNSRQARASRLGSFANRLRAVNIHLVDRATKPHTIAAKNAGVLAWGPPRSRRYAMRVAHPGTRATNFVERSAKQVLPTAGRIALQEADKQVKLEISRG